METVLGVIGGSGLYDIDGLTRVEVLEGVSPWGKTSDKLIQGYLGELRVVFLARHGKGHLHTPSAINYRANIDALKRVGVTDIVSISACGSLRENLPPGTFVLVDQFIDHTFRRERSFFGTGMVAHVSMAKPTCSRVANHLEAVLQEEKISYHRGGTYVTIEGPHFSTYAESQMFRAMGADVIGMTNMPEAKLAREAEICYQTVAMVTDFDCWRAEEAAVDVPSVLAVMQANSSKAKLVIQQVAKKMQQKRVPCTQGCDVSLDMALMTAKEQQDPALLDKLSAILARQASR